MSTAMPPDIGWNLENSYAELPEVLHAEAQPARFPAPRVTIVNHLLADELGLSLRGLSEGTAARLFGGQQLPAAARPLAQAYAGHQFGGFTLLGDGRALLVGEQRTPTGRLFDVQFKGSGQTPFSRRGDGRAALGPMLREYIISEAMHALGIPTTRSLAVVTTGEPVYREKPLAGAILTRVAKSHIRVGTFQYLAAREDQTALRQLADYTIARHYPELVARPQRYLELLRAVMARQASLIAQWQLVGFIHGVMNTDNMALSGETIDYGPCAFMDAYDPATVFSSIDHGGRYAYGNQPGIAQWNLARFAETLLPLIAPEPNPAIELATAALHDFSDMFHEAWLQGMRRKLGLRTAAADDRPLIETLLEWMQAAGADFTNTFDRLSSPGRPEGEPYDSADFMTWYDRWQQRLARDGQPIDTAYAVMQRANPAIIPHNLRVEEALAAATEHDDLSPLHRLLDVLATPYARRPSLDAYQAPPPPGQCRYRTFCGT